MVMAMVVIVLVVVWLMFGGGGGGGGVLACLIFLSKNSKTNEHTHTRQPTNVSLCAFHAQHTIVSPSIESSGEHGVNIKH